MAVYELFRFQLLPASQHQQELFVFEVPLSAEQIRQRKNEFLGEVLTDLPKFRHRGLQIRHKLVRVEDGWYVFKVGALKSVDRDTEEFRKEKVESWPNVTVFVQNTADTQVIAISRNQRAFSATSTVARLFLRAIAPDLRHFGLTIQIREQFEDTQFWSVIAENEGRISRVRFEMVAPNMANISRALRIDLRQLNRDSNCEQANVELHAPSGGTLEVSPENELIDGCVEYSSLGGGDIAIKIRGLKKEIRTSSSVKTIEIDEAVLQAPVGELDAVLKSVFGK